MVLIFMGGGDCQGAWGQLWGGQGSFYVLIWLVCLLCNCLLSCVLLGMCVVLHENVYSKKLNEWSCMIMGKVCLIKCEGSMRVGDAIGNPGGETGPYEDHYYYCPRDMGPELSPHFCSWLQDLGQLWWFSGPLLDWIMGSHHGASWMGFVGLWTHWHCKLLACVWAFSWGEGQSLLPN